jgi:hypothetical protein
MISLTKRLKQETEGGAGSRGSNGLKKGGQANGTSRASIRDKLLVKEVRRKQRERNLS